MRTSIKLFLGSLGLLGLGLFVYDLKLNATFRTSDYTTPFFDYESQSFTAFDRIRLNSGKVLNVQLVQGDFKVKVNPLISEWLRIRQEGSSLVISAEFPDHVEGFPYDYAVYISCPRLREIATSGQFMVRGNVEIDSTFQNPWYKPTRITGFTQDSLRLLDKGGNVVLEASKIGDLQATIGTGAMLTVEPGNTFGSGEIAVVGKGQLTIKDAGNLKLNHYLADSSTLILSGAAAKQLLKNKEP